MRLEIVCLLVLTIISAFATSPAVLKNEQERFLIAASTFSFTTFTLIKSRTTVSSTFTLTTTCTTSTATLSTCTTGRRRRGVFYDEVAENIRHRRAALFYNSEDIDNKEGTVFLPVEDTARDIVNDTSVTGDVVIPLEIQSGFSLPEGAEANRFLLTFGVSTITSVVVTTSTFSLTAICMSTTGFPLCGAVGK